MILTTAPNLTPYKSQAPTRIHGICRPFRQGAGRRAARVWSEVGFRMYSKSNILLLCWAFEANQTSFELITFLLLSSESWDCRCVACCLALVVCPPSGSSFYFCWPLFQSPVSVQSSGNLTEGKEDPKQGGLEMINIYSSRYFVNLQPGSD